MLNNETIQFEPLSEDWKSEQRRKLYEKTEVAAASVSSLLNGNPAEVTIKEFDSPDIPNSYFLQGKITVKDALYLLNFTWNPSTKILDRYAMLLESEFTGRGIGTSINTITENLAIALGAKAFVISAITNNRWYEKLVRDGFVPAEGKITTVKKTLSR